MKKKILITGTLGFIFNNFVRHVCPHYPEYNYVGVDCAMETYHLKNEFYHPNYKFYLADIANEHIMNNIFNAERPDFIIHGAAQSFVDDSIKSAAPFIRSNVVGTQVMVDLSLKYRIEKFIYISTDEVYGQLTINDASWTEESITKPRNPYSASKLAGELIVYAANQTHNLNYNITRSSNNYGAYQPPRNLVPKIITSIINNRQIPIHGHGKQIREWLYVKDNCQAIMLILQQAPANEIFNIGSGNELTNLNMVKKIADILNKSPQIDFVKDRPGHDFRYSIDFSKIKKLGYYPQSSFDQVLEQTVQWYLDNKWYFDV